MANPQDSQANKTQSEDKKDTVVGNPANVQPKTNQPDKELGGKEAGKSAPEKTEDKTSAACATTKS